MDFPTLTYDHVGTNPILILERQCPALTYDHVITKPKTLSEMPITYIWLTNDQRKSQHLHLSMRGTNPPCQKAPALTSDQPMIEERNCTYIWSTNDQRKAQHLYLINTGSKKGSALISDQHMIEERLCTYIQRIQGTNPSACLKMHALTSDPVRTNPTVISKWPLVLDWST